VYLYPAFNAAKHCDFASRMISLLKARAESLSTSRASFPPECVNRLRERVGDPPGLVIFEGLSAIVARELLESFPLLLPKSDAVNFLATLFPELDSNTS